MKKTLTENEKTLLLLQELEFMTELNFRIQMDMEIDELIHEVVQSLRENVEFDGCNIGIIDEQGYMKINRILVSDLSEKVKTPKFLMKMMYDSKFDVKTSPIWLCKVAREDKELYLPQIDITEYPEAKDFLEITGITSIYLLPIKLENKILGILSLANYGTDMNLTDFERELIKRRIVVIARIIENSRLYNQIKYQKNVLEMQANIIKEDLFLAKRIQNNLLPSSFPELSGMIGDFRYFSMFAVGGDYFDFYVPEDKNGIGILLTDASGHGVGAAFLTSMVKMAFDSYKDNRIAKDPAELLKNINSSLLGKTADNFVTAVYCYIDLKTSTAHFAAAGHHPIYLLRNDEISSINPSGKILGVFENIHFDTDEIKIYSNDKFYFYTDGLIEAINEKQEEFEKYFPDILLKNADKNPMKINDAIVDALLTFTGKDKQFDDDIALICLEID